MTRHRMLVFISGMLLIAAVLMLDILYFEKAHAAPPVKGCLFLQEVMTHVVDFRDQGDSEFSTVEFNSRTLKDDGPYVMDKVNTLTHIVYTDPQLQHVPAKLIGQGTYNECVKERW